VIICETCETNQARCGSGSCQPCIDSAFWEGERAIEEAKKETARLAEIEAARKEEEGVTI
jgi:hypothetical protein